MTRRTVTVEDRTFEVALAEPGHLAERTWLIAHGRVIDEITGSPPAAFRVRVIEPELTVRAGEGGSFAIIARPWHRFPPLDAPSYAIRIVIEADGYVSPTVTIIVPTAQRAVAAPAPGLGTNLVTLNSSAGLSPGQLLLLGPAGPGVEALTIAQLGPGADQVTLAAPVTKTHNPGDPVVADAFTPVTVPDVALHRTGVTIRGRAVHQNAGGLGSVPIAGATVTMQGLWRTAQDVAKHLPAVAPDIVSVSPGLYRMRGAGAAFAVQSLTVVPGDDRQLVEPASSAESKVTVSTRRNLVAPPAAPPYSVLRIGADDPATCDYVEITALSSLGTVDEPSQVVLQHPLRHPHRRAAWVQRVSPGAPAAPKSLTADAVAGDACLFLNDLTGLPAVGTAAVSGGPAPEFQELRRFTATSDAQGYFALPPLSRVAQIRMQASAPTLAAITMDFQPDYAQRENWVDVVFA